MTSIPYSAAIAVSSSGESMRTSFLRLVEFQGSFDEGGGCCGIVSQADIALKAPSRTAEVVGEVSQHTRTPAQSASAMVTDPVCGMRVDPKRAAARADFEGATYYFCSDACRERFEMSPDDYVARVTAVRRE